MDDEQIQCPECGKWLASEAPYCTCGWREE